MPRGEPTRTFNVRLTDDQRDTLQWLADYRALSLGELVRTLLRERLSLLGKYCRHDGQLLRCGDCGRKL